MQVMIVRVLSLFTFEQEPNILFYVSGTNPGGFVGSVRGLGVEESMLNYVFSLSPAERQGIPPYRNSLRGVFVQGRSCSLLAVRRRGNGVG